MKLLVLLLLGLASLATAEVVQSFRSKCPQFFYSTPKTEVRTPTVLKGPQYKQICQRWEGNYRFATLYNTRHRIPVYSAYTFSGKKHNARHNWMIEPQLDLGLLPKDRDMRDMKSTEKDTFENQAQNEDYSDQKYCSRPVTRGHVFPHGYAASKEQAESTFTLTNAAPQTDESNQEWANEVEEQMLRNITRSCDLNESPAYIVTGVVPGDTWIKIRRNGREIPEGMNIPSHYWTALTCTKKGKPFSTAFLAQQTNQKKTICSKFEKKELSVDALEIELKSLYKTPLCVFRECAKKHKRTTKIM